jgi:hypothetical protein
MMNGKSALASARLRVHDYRITRGIFRMRAFLLSLAMLFAMPVLAHAEVSAADSTEIDGKVAAFFTSLNQGDTRPAFEKLFLPRVSDKKQEVDNLINQTALAISYLHGPVKWDLADQKEMGKVLIYRNYIVYSDEMPMKFRFVFFKTNKGWQAQSVFFNDVAISDFE